jgi:hypothetical protein
VSCGDKAGANDSPIACFNLWTAVRCKASDRLLVSELSADYKLIEERCYQVDDLEESSHRKSEEENNKRGRADLTPTGPNHAPHLRVDAFNVASKPFERANGVPISLDGRRSLTGLVVLRHATTFPINLLLRSAYSELEGAIGSGRTYEMAGGALSGAAGRYGLRAGVTESRHGTGESWQTRSTTNNMTNSGVKKSRDGLCAVRQQIPRTRIRINSSKTIDLRSAVS